MTVHEQLALEAKKQEKMHPNQSPKGENNMTVSRQPTTQKAPPAPTPHEQKPS